MFLYLFVVILLLTPVINIPGPLVSKSLDVYALLFFILIGIYSIVVSGKFRFRRLIIPIAISFAVLILHVLLLEIVFQFGDSTVYTILRLPITIVLAYLCAITLINAKNEYALQFFFKSVIVAALLQGAVIWFTFLIPGFRDFMSLIFYRAAVEDADHLILLRVPGFVSSGGDGLSMNQSLLSIVGLMGCYSYFYNYRYRNLIVVGLFLSMISTAFTGRSGLYLGIVFFVLIISAHNYNFRISRSFFGFAIASLAIIFPLYLLSDQIGAYGEVLLEEYGYEYPLVRLLRGFIDMRAQGVYSDNTISTLLSEMVIVPTETFRFLFGNGDFGQLASTFVSTDVGYFRIWHGLGLVGLLLFLIGIFVYPLIVVYRQLVVIRNNPRMKEIYNTHAALFNIIFIVLLFGVIANYKIIYLSSRIYAFVYFVLLFLIYNKFRAVNYGEGSKSCAE